VSGAAEKLVTFTDLRPWYAGDRNPLAGLLPDHARVTDDLAAADLVIHSLYTDEYVKARGTRLCYSHEPVTSTARRHWSLDWRLIDQPRHLRMSANLIYLLVEPPGPGRELVAEPRDPADRRFAAFVYWNGDCAMRNAFFDLLHARRAVDALGEIRHNAQDDGLVGRHHPDWRMAKVAVLNKYRFSVAFENSEHLGYTTEKVFDALQADTVPIYWGNPAVALDVDPRAIISFYEHGSLTKLVDHVLEVDADPDRYEEYRRHNPFRTGRVAEQLDVTESAVRAFLARVVEASGREPTAPHYWRRTKHAVKSVTQQLT
jgi:alpha(1,3/1,4) fucosyltransferase